MHYQCSCCGVSLSGPDAFVLDDLRDPYGEETFLLCKHCIKQAPSLKEMCQMRRTGAWSSWMQRLFSRSPRVQRQLRQLWSAEEWEREADREAWEYEADDGSAGTAKWT